jgi:hypothetical protein
MDLHGVGGLGLDLFGLGYETIACSFYRGKEVWAPQMGWGGSFVTVRIPLHGIRMLFPWHSLKQKFKNFSNVNAS